MWCETRAVSFCHVSRPQTRSRSGASVAPAAVSVHTHTHTRRRRDARGGAEAITLGYPPPFLDCETTTARRRTRPPLVAWHPSRESGPPASPFSSRPATYSRARPRLLDRVVRDCASSACSLDWFGSRAPPRAHGCASPASLARGSRGAFAATQSRGGPCARRTAHLQGASRSGRMIGACAQRVAWWHGHDWARDRAASKRVWGVVSVSSSGACRHAHNPPAGLAVCVPLNARVVGGSAGSAALI